MEKSSSRRRGAKNPSSPPTTAPSATPVPNEIEDATSRVISLLDIGRVILTLVGASCALSYYLTSGSSLLWNYNPWWLHSAQIGRWWSGPVSLTQQQLALYNGTDPHLPIYLAINGTIFDVTEGSHTYGPGGSYAVFAGRDATRAFVTGCFLDDRTGDLRGAEDLYIPMDDPDEAIASGEKKMRAQRERREAKKRVLKEVRKWEAFYRNHQKYFEVGRLIGVPEYTGEAPRLCEAAEKGRPKRKNMQKDVRGESAPGKPVQ